MPAYLTHYLYGKYCFGKMREGALKQVLRKHKEVYALGLSGPDIFFYHLPDFILLRRLPGSMMHQEECGRFLRTMYTQAMLYKSEEREIAIAYLAGFLGHYRLDHACHPYIYQYARKEAQRNRKKEKNPEMTIHFQYECALDHYFLEHYLGKKTAEMSQLQITATNRKERKVISGLLADSYNRTYAYPNMTALSVRSVLFHVRLVMSMLFDPHGNRERFFNLVTRRLPMSTNPEGLFVNDNCYGVPREEWKKVNGLFLNAAEQSAREYERLTRLLEMDRNSEKYPDTEKEFLEKIGNLSYHTERNASRRKINC